MVLVVERMPIWKNNRFCFKQDVERPSCLNKEMVVDIKTSVSMCAI